MPKKLESKDKGGKKLPLKKSSTVKSNKSAKPVKSQSSKAAVVKKASIPIAKKQSSVKVDKKASVSKSVKKAAAAASASTGITHYILMLDDSGSMTGKPWSDLQKACQAFLSEIVKSPDAANTKISCIIYNSYARTVFEDESPSDNLIKKIQF